MLLKHTCKYYLLAIILLASCKKDLVHFKNVQQVDSHTATDRLNRVLFINDSVGIIAGGERFLNAAILITKDGGHTWKYNSFPKAGKGLYGIAQAPNGTIYTCGFDGNLLSSNDEGNTWQINQITYQLFNDVVFTDATHGIAIGGNSYNYGYIYHIDNNGRTSSWDSLNFQLNRVKFANTNAGYICGYGALMRTMDGGRNWNYLNISGDDFTGLTFLKNGAETWTCGYNGSIYHSTDNGDSWERLRDGNDITLIHYHLLDIFFKDATNGWAVGENGVVIRTDDGGHHWEQYDQFTGNALRSIALCPDGDLIVAGDNGALYRLKY